MTARPEQYEGFFFTVEEDTDEGLLPVPVAGPPGTPAKVVRRHGGLTTRVVRWFATVTNEQ